MNPVDKQTLSRLIAPAVTLAQEHAAGRDRLAASLKSPGQLVSDADREVEELIRRTLKTEFGDVAIIGEEGGGSLDGGASGWVIDPIDGTSNFLRGLPMWGISIGLLEAGVSVAGAIALPDLDIVLTASKDQGVEVNGRAWKRSSFNAAKMIALGENDFETGHETDRRADEFRRKGFTVVRYQCAIFALANAALGRLDGYIERGCRLWDVAGAWVICDEAGMAVDVRPLGHERYAIDARWSEGA